MNYYIADTHFGHEAVIRFDRRPFSSVEEMEEIMRLNWNAAVRPGDTVYIVGDFAWGKKDEWLRIVRRLNGQKVLVRGNHDLHNLPSELKKEFADICDYKEITDYSRDGEARKIILSHYPIMFYKHSNNAKCYMLCGHVHRTAENDWLEHWLAELRESTANGASYGHCGQIINVGSMMPYIHYCPRTLDEIIRGRDDYLKSIDVKRK